LFFCYFLNKKCWTVVFVKGMVEKWLLLVEEMMMMSLRYVIKDAVAAYVKTIRKKWVIEWPGQVVLCSSQVYWTQDVEMAIQNHTLKVIRH
jgi:dynein heavy chain